MVDIDLVSILDQEARKRIKLYPHRSNRASEAGHPCIRFLVLAFSVFLMKAISMKGLSSEKSRMPVLRLLSNSVRSSGKSSS